jgi:RHS repeat-associated protein
MTNQASTQTISLPKGGGALSGIGEKFTPDLFTGTGNFSVPIALPPGRNGFQPQLSLSYSSGNGNGPFGLGWSLSIPEVSRKTSSGVPLYNDKASLLEVGERRDVFVLSGAEDLVPVHGTYPGTVRYRPRTEGLFARIEHVSDSRDDYWSATGKDGVLNTYGRESGASTPAVIRKTDSLAIFAWKLTETRDPFGNLVRYDYASDTGEGHGRRWSQPLLQRIRYVDYGDPADERFLVHVEFQYEDRPDPFSTHRAGFEIRSTRRCKSIKVSIHTADGTRREHREYVFAYRRSAGNGVSLLQQIDIVGYDDEGNAYRDAPDGAHPRQLPPVTFGYTPFAPERRKFEALSGRDLPSRALGARQMDLVDLHGSGLPDILEMNGMVRYWRNLGQGQFDMPRPMHDAPTLSLADAGVQIVDANGDGRADLLVTGGSPAGYFSLTHPAGWDRHSFERYEAIPSFDLGDPEVRMVDLDGDGYTDVLRSGSRMECFFNDPDRRLAWQRTRFAARQTPDTFPDVSFSDPRVKLADISGDGLSDIVLVHDGNVEYWPNLGHGRWGRCISMRHPPRFKHGYDPKHVLLGDVDGDGLADLVYVDQGKVLLWINQCGNSWSETPIVIPGTASISNISDVRLADLHGTGVAGLIWSVDAMIGRRHMMFLDFTGGMKPYLLSEMDNHMGAVTRVHYRPSTSYYLEDQKTVDRRWRTTLPFPVQVVAKVEAVDEISRGKLTTEYRYHNGYWDGAEREFRGFGRVEQLDTETFDDYHAAGAIPFDAVQQSHFAKPKLTRTWFHQGPVGEEFGDWEEADYSNEYWQGDPQLLGHTTGVNAFLLRYNDRGARSSERARRLKRDALRALRGSVLRSEVYTLDNDDRKIGDEAARYRPDTVTESAYELEEIEPPAVDSDRKRIFFPRQTSQRTTRWDRGDDPMTRFSFLGDYDAFGQARTHTSVAMPRLKRHQRAITAAVIGAVNPNETHLLATHSRTLYAGNPGDVHIRDRVAQIKSYEPVNPPTGPDSPTDSVEAALRAQLSLAQQLRDGFDRLTPGDAKLVGHQINRYDGTPFEGLPVGQLGQHGALIHTETLVFTDDVLDAAYSRSSDRRRPGYLGGSAASPPGTPAGFGGNTGYRKIAADAHGYENGYYADTLRRRLSARGLPLVLRDAIGSETAFAYDAHELLPLKVRDPLGLETLGQYNYRLLQLSRVTDPNGNTTSGFYNPVGLPTKQYIAGRENAAGVPTAGGTADKPDATFEYDFLNFARHRAGGNPGLSPAFVHTRRRVHHALDGLSDDVIESREYSDGYGRLIQTRAQAEQYIFGTSGDDVGLPVSSGNPATTVAALAVGNRMTVSGWQAFDNKGKVVRKYEPYFSSTWDFQPETEAKRGEHIVLFYNSGGELVRTINPDGSEQRIIYGRPESIARLQVAPGDVKDVPTGFSPSPWERYSYDANDLAPVTRGISGATLSGEAQVEHHFTPASVVLDALGRGRCSIARNGAEPAKDWVLTRSNFDTRGNILVATDALGRQALVHHHDLLNRSMAIESIDAGWRTSVLDAFGNLIEYRDSKGSLSLRIYDMLGRPREVWARNQAGDALTLRERLAYGDDGPRAAARTLNALGRPVKHYDEAGLLEMLQYDIKGNLLEKSRRTVRDSALASGWLANWDAANADDALEITSYRTSSRYDALNRLTDVTLPQDVDGERKRLVPRYNRAGALEAVRFGNAEYVRHIAYNARRQRVLIAYGNDVATRYAYDPLTFRLARLRTERMTRTAGAGALAFQVSGTALQDIFFRYDLVGNVAAIDERTPDCGVATGPGSLGRDQLLREFTYDPVYQLLSATGRACRNTANPRGLDDDPRCGFQVGGARVTSAASTPNLTESYLERYRYDPAGNLLELRYLAASGNWKRLYGIGGLPNDQWTSAPNNQLTSLLNGATSHSQQFDRNGNLIRHGAEKHYVWDHGDRLTGYRVQAAAGSPSSIEARYLNGADGLRVKKWIRNQQGHVDSSVEIDAAFEHHRHSEPAGTTANNALHVMDGQNRIAVVRVGPALDRRDASPTVQYCFGDHLGSSHVVVGGADASGNDFVNREEYFPYGETSVGSFGKKRYRYMGKERDEESGLYCFGARYFMPAFARWVSCDPAGPVDGLNLFRYAENNPVRYVDSQGMETVDIANPVRPQPVFTGAWQYNQLPPESKESYKLLHRTNFETVITDSIFNKYQRRVERPGEGLDKPAAQPNSNACVPTTIRHYLRKVLRYDFDTEGIKKLMEAEYGRKIPWDDRAKFAPIRTGPLGQAVLHDMLPERDYFLDDVTFRDWAKSTFGRPVFDTSEGAFLKLAKRAERDNEPIIIELKAHWYLLEGVEVVNGKNVYKVSDSARSDRTHFEFKDLAFEGKFVGWAPSLQSQLQHLKPPAPAVDQRARDIDSIRR